MIHYYITSITYIKDPLPFVVKAYYEETVGGGGGEGEEERLWGTKNMESYYIMLLWTTLPIAYPLLKWTLPLGSRHFLISTPIL